MQFLFAEEDWQNENKPSRLPPNEQGKWTQCKYKCILVTQTLYMFIEGGDERRRAMRRDDPRRHTLGGDILVYGNSQHPHAHQMVQQQRAMDLEVSRT